MLLTIFIKVDIKKGFCYTCKNKAKSQQERGNKLKRLAKEIIEGRRLNREEDLSFFETADLAELCDGADNIREYFCGNHIDLCTIINGRSGKCSEDCKFCAQSAFNNTGCETYEMLDKQTILEDCKKREAAGVHAYSIVTAGRAVTGKELDNLVEIYYELNRECNISLCASNGFLTREAFERIKDAGVSTYHCNIETSRANFKNICSTHSYEDKIDEIKLAKSIGLNVCSGGIIGMGETFDDRVDMALQLSELEVFSIPINVLMPIKGTPLGDIDRLTNEEILRSVAMFRYINPTAYIRIAAGRSYFEDGGRILFKSGANATITGDMLTTVGNNTAQDIVMFKEMGFDIASNR